MRVLSTTANLFACDVRSATMHRISGRGARLLVEVPLYPPEVVNVHRKSSAVCIRLHLHMSHLGLPMNANDF